VKCKQFLQELTNYLDGALDARTKSELEEHLTWCHDCHVVHDTTKKTIEIYRDSKLYELPVDLASRLRSAIMEKCRSSKKPPCDSAEAKPVSSDPAHTPQST
jgi:anti-sigma factor RsiW